MLSDYLLLTGAALCLLSLPMAVISLLATRPPRGAAIVFVLGCLVLFGAAWTGRDDRGWYRLPDAWARVTGSAPAEVPASAPATQTPAPAPAETSAPVAPAEMPAEVPAPAN